MSNAPHLIERAAARLSAAGAVPGRLSSTPLLGGVADTYVNDSVPPGATGAPATYLNGAAVAPMPPVSLALLEKAGLMTDQAGRGRVSEELWLVQRQVLRTAFAGLSSPPSASPEALELHPNLVMITSARPNEGKSFTALNLGASIARQGDHAVLVIDTDVKERSITSLLGLREAPGLQDLIVDGGLDAGRLEQSTEIPRLSLLTVGRSQTRGADALATRHVGRLLHGIARRHRDRLIILDGAPALATSDPAALAAIVGQILFVVEAEKTQRGQVEAALDLIGDCPAITLVLNKMQQSGENSFGAYAPYYTS